MATRCNFSPYEGTEKYCFISYAHKDSEEIIPVLNELNARGYRIWFDDGIAPGSEWPEYIAEHLNGSSIVLAFISPNSIASPNCRREITFALSKKKPFIGIFLCETEMSLGMEMQLSAQQCIMKYQMPSEEKFYDKLCSTDIFSVCHADGKQDAAPQAAGTVSSAANGIDAEDMAAVAKMKAAAAAVPADRKEQQLAAKVERKEAKASAKAEKQENGTQQSGKKNSKLLKKILIGAGAAAAAVIAAVVLLVVSNNAQKSDVTLSDGGTITVSSLGSSTSVQIKDASNVDDAAIKKLSGKKGTSLVFQNCDVTGDLQQVKNLSEYKRVTLQNSTISDWGFLASLTGAYSLEIENCDITDADIAAIPGNISKITLINCTGVTSIDGLSTAGLTALNISGTNVSDIQVLAAAEKLTGLDISNTQVTNLNPLAALTKLKSLNADNDAVTLTKPLMSIEINEVHFRNCGLENADFLENAARLQIVDLGDNPITEMGFLMKSAETLQKLYVDNTGLMEAWMETFERCPSVTVLDISGLQLLGLDFMGNFPALTTLYAENCGTEDTTGLADCVNLEELYLGNNNISSMDLTGLSSLKKLDLRNNDLTTAEKLPAVEMKILILCGNQIPTNTLPDGLTCEYIVMDYSEIKEGDPLTKDICSILYLVDCPEDQKLNVRDITKENIKFLTAEEVEQNISAYGYDPYEWNVE